MDSAEPNALTRTVVQSRLLAGETVLRGFFSSPALGVAALARS